jgi:delta14-sterol reductase
VSCLHSSTRSPDCTPGAERRIEAFSPAAERAMIRDVLVVRETLSVEGLAFGVLAAFGFTAALFVGARVLPGRRVPGQPLPDGTRIGYRLNGLSLWVATHMATFCAVVLGGFSLTPLLERFWSLLLAANLLTVAWLLPMYLAGRRRARERGERTRAWWADLWYGSELNPSLFGIDLKTFAYQPSLIGLSLLNWAFAWAQWEELGYLTTQMILYQAFWWLYLTTHYLHEEGVLSMWDVIAEKLGFMLLWGDLVLVPFFYCIAGWFLLGQTESIPVPRAAALVGLFVLGLWIFRGANAQKNRFKADPACRIWGVPARAVGGRLLASGFWAIGRKLNYTGEILVYGSFALTTGFSSVVPYLLPLWLCVLLPHRAWRDEQRCRAKYGALWDEYCRIARFRMVPWLY